ncbi:MAG: M23 family metallopeptidase [Candidatus Omnitrophica bacterium]|nr:M23 family metallopeptidase [Candidatus Omnitrophota bacterium]
MAFSVRDHYFLLYIMKQWHIIIGSALTAALGVVVLHQPVSLALYKIKEPYFQCPLKAESKKLAIRNDLKGSGDFGAKRRNGRSHSGIDILAEIGTPVYAAKSGIAFPGNVPTGYGKYVMIYHPDGFQTIYGHLLNYIVRPTQKVRQGERIGYVGKTGNAVYRSVQPHLHFEIKDKGDPRDPKPLMR